MKNLKFIITFILTLFILSITNCYLPPDKSHEDYYSDTIAVWDSEHGDMHKLIFHTIYLENSTISGFSLNTLQMETFHITHEETEKFEQMKNISGINSYEIKCISCHPDVKMSKKPRTPRKIFNRD
jgi:hypothetical protein